MWRDEYRSIVKEGFRVLTLFSEKNIVWHEVLQQSMEGNFGDPFWLTSRAARFAQFAKHYRWDADGFPKKNIESLVTAAKMAAAFLSLSSRTIGPVPKKIGKSVERLLVPPDGFGCGLVELPLDAVKVEGNRSLVQPDDWLPLCKEDSGMAVMHPPGQPDASSKDTCLPVVDKVGYITAQPMCGWNEYIGAGSECEWKDPRMCCLCRTFGDDDGDSGPVYFAENENPVARMGRLLPMNDSLWVHASCAIWSSEVYEAPTGGTLHAIEKARSRASQLKCFGCGRNGASVGCFKTNCSRNYHFPCAKACGAVFTEKQEMYCAEHRSCASDLLTTESVEHMKTLKVAMERKAGAEKITLEAEDGKCSRVGALVVHSLGEVNQTSDGFHSERYIMPTGYTATRIFWSTTVPRSRTVYILKVAESGTGSSVFTATPADDPTNPIRAKTVNEVYSTLCARAKLTNSKYFSHGNLFSKLPARRKTTKKAFGLNGPQVHLTAKRDGMWYFLTACTVLWIRTKSHSKGAGETARY